MGVLGLLGVISGYGDTERIIGDRIDLPTLRHLKATTLKIINHKVCQKYYEHKEPRLHVTKNMICAGEVPFEDDACKVRLYEACTLPIMMSIIKDLI